MDPELFKKCKYLFYELKNEETGGEGGYKIELSFEEKVQHKYCGLGKFADIITDGGKSVGFKNDKNQSILSSFVITNETIMEMRRVMASKCTVNFQGTTFNIFSLVKLVNKMKSES